jgi:hypothetical protein
MEHTCYTVGDGTYMLYINICHLLRAVCLSPVIFGMPDYELYVDKVCEDYVTEGVRCNTLFSTVTSCCCTGRLHTLPPPVILTVPVLLGAGMQATYHMILFIRIPVIIVPCRSRRRPLHSSFCWPGAHLEVSLNAYPWVNICTNNMQTNY